MDSSKRHTKIKQLIILLFVGGCSGWLNDYFDDRHLPIKVDVLKWLNICLPNENIENWGKSVRERKMTKKSCAFTEKVERCSFNSYQNASAEYLKQLLMDARDLCKNEADWTEDNMILGILFTIGILITIIILMCVMVKIERGKDVYQMDEDVESHDTVN